MLGITNRSTSDLKRGRWESGGVASWAAAAKGRRAWVPAQLWGLRYRWSSVRLRNGAGSKDLSPQMLHCYSSLLPFISLFLWSYEMLSTRTGAIIREERKYLEILRETRGWAETSCISHCCCGKPKTVKSYLLTFLTLLETLPFSRSHCMHQWGCYRPASLLQVSPVCVYFWLSFYANGLRNWLRYPVAREGCGSSWMCLKSCRQWAVFQDHTKIWCEPSKKERLYLCAHI